MRPYSALANFQIFLIIAKFLRRDSPFISFQMLTFHLVFVLVPFVAHKHS